MGLGRIVQMLKTSKEFDFVYKNSYKFRTEMLDICVLRANLASEFFAKFRRLPCDMVGFSVSKKVGIAVERNLVKRRLRAICREFFSLGNSSLGASFALGGNFGEQQTHKSSFIPKISSKYKTSTANTRICERSEATNTRICDSNQIDSNDSIESLLQKFKPHPKSLPQGEGLAFDSPSLAGSYFSNSPSLAEGARGWVESTSAKNTPKSESQKDTRASSANLVCIFIAKSQILQTPFATLKGIIFDALKKQINFRQDLHKKPRTSRHNAPNRANQNRANQNRANQNRAFQNPNYNPNKGAL